MVNGCNNIFIERNGAIEKVNDSFESPQKLTDTIQHIVSLANRRVNEASPITDSRLLDGSRVNIVLSPVSIDGPAITIRKFPNFSYTMEKLITIGSITSEAAEFLHSLVIAGYNILRKQINTIHILSIEHCSFVISSDSLKGNLSNTLWCCEIDSNLFS